MRMKKFEITIISIGSILYCIFCNWISVELPHMTWFDFLPLVEKYYNNKLELTDLITRYGEHGMFGYNILFLFNTIIFKLTTFFDVYINNIIVILGGFISVHFLNTFVENNKTMYKLGIITISLVQFSTFQLSSGAMETQVRLGILFFILSTLYVDNIFLISKHIAKKSILMACCLIIINVNIFGTFYSFAGLPAIFIVGLLLIYKNNERIKDVFPILITYVMSTIIYIYEYNLFDKSSGVNSQSLLNNIFVVLSQPIEVLKSLLGYNACGIFGSAVYLDAKFTANIYLLIGFIITSIIIYSIYEFIKLKMYKRTFVPVYFISYSFVVFIFVIIARPASWQWTLNEWYIVHTKLQYIGVVWILLYSYQNNKFKVNINRIVVISSFIFIIIINVMGNIIELKRAPYVVEYYENKQPYLFAETIEELPVDGSGNTPLLASPEYTIQSIEILRKYGLSVYKYYPIYEKYREIYPVTSNGLFPLNLYDGQILDKSGYYEDKWVGKEAEISVYSKTGKINLELYYPFDYDGTQNGILYINDEKYTEYSFEKQLLEISVSVEPEKIANLKFENKYSFVTPPDVRELSFVLEIIK